jgi:hypothetical protein
VSCPGDFVSTDATLRVRVSPTKGFGRHAGSNSAGSPKRTGNVEGKGNLRRSISWASSGKNSLGRFTVRRTTIRKRMRAKLRELKQQLRMHMNDPVPQTGGWLKLVVQGYFNYYAVPGNLESLAVFRDRLLGLWWRTLRRRSQQPPTVDPDARAGSTMATSTTARAPSLSRSSLRRQSSEIRTGCANERPSGSGEGVARNHDPYSALIYSALLPPRPHHVPGRRFWRLLSLLLRTRTSSHDRRRRRRPLTRDAAQTFCRHQLSG